MIAFLREVARRGKGDDPTRSPLPAFQDGVASQQHERFAEVLKNLGLNLKYVPPSPDSTDGLFIGDAAISLPEIAIIARPNATARFTAIETVIQALGQHRPLQSIVEPATLDAGDVLRIGRTLYVAETSRTNAEGIAQLLGIVRPFGYEVKTVQTKDDVRLKSACTFVPPHSLVANPAWIDTVGFSKFAIIPVDENEPLAANTVTVVGTTLIGASFPKTEKRLRAAGVATQRVDLSEFEKAKAGVSCLSLILEPRTMRAESGGAEIKPIHVRTVPEPVGPFSQAIVHQGIIYVSPLPPFDLKTPRRRRIPVEEQTENAIRNLSVVLNSVGSSLGHAVHATVHISDPKHLEGIDKVYARMFGQHRPARSVLVNPGLPAGVAVEIEAVAAVPESSG